MTNKVEYNIFTMLPLHRHRCR